MIDLQNKLWLAPLAGITDNAYRTICKRWGADITVSEMVSADGLVYAPRQTLPYAVFEEEQRPYAIQLFGSSPAIMAKGAEIIAGLKPDLIDINMGCPVKKVIQRNAGSALMKDIPLAVEIIKAVKAICHKYELPLSVKFRSGWDADSINALAFARAMELAGADLIIIHPRTRSQMFGGRSNWDLIREIKENVTIPVIGNGDITSAEDAARMLQETRCDGIMIGRAVLGRPWIFHQIKIYLEEGRTWHPQPEEVMHTIQEHLKLKITLSSHNNPLPEMRPHLNAYTKGYPGSSQVRELINKSTDLPQIINAISNLILLSDSYN